MPGKAVGWAAVDLPWLCPNTNGLIGLAERPAELERCVSADPGLFVFLVRFAMGESGSPFIPPSDLLLSAALPETAAAYLAVTPPAGWLDPSSSTVSILRGVADLAAVFARRLAQHTGRAAPEAAETAARLAPLGWYAVAAVDPTEAAACLHDPGFGDDPLGCQQSWWGLDHAAVARRLAGRWRFPRRLAGVVANLSMPFEAAAHAGAEYDLFAVVALAVGAAEQRSTVLGLSRMPDRDRLLAHLGLNADSLEPLVTAARPVDTPRATSQLDPNPYHVPLLRSLLRMAAEARRRSGTSLVVRLEERIDELHRSAADLSELAGDRLRDAKLEAVAELAAGAGHEINNPLAVISGQAQRLLRTEMDDDQADGLRSIVRQTQRISGILRDLMQFARPPKPDRQTFAAAGLVQDVRRDLTPVADEFEVRLEVGSLPAGNCVTADPQQLRHALAAVVRNGIEAAGRGGWVRIGCEAAGDDVRFVVEDSGPGMTPHAAEHAFDPFFCGRNAGRGRGLGLPTAWRFAQRNAGDLRYETIPGGPTRFIFTLPLAEESVRPDRKCA